MIFEAKKHVGNMRKILLILLILPFVGSAQVGFNCVNSTISFTTQADSNYLLELVPEGGSFAWRDRYDKLNEDPQDVINLYKFMQRNNRSFWVIFVASDSVPMSQNISAIYQLKAAGVPVRAAAYVNEPFYPAGGYSFNFSLYEAGYLDFCNQITSNWPDMDILLPIAPKPLSIFTKTQGGQSSHDNWNNSGFFFKSEHPEFRIVGGDVHIYYTGAFVQALGVTATTDEVGAEKAKTTLPKDRVYNPSDTTDEKYWRDIYYQSQPAVFWEVMLNYLQSHNLTGYVTECGYIDAGSLNGTWTYAAKAFELMNWYGNDERLSSFNWHGGVITQSTVGVVAPRKSFDIQDPENPNNCRSATFDAFCLYFNTDGQRLPYSYQIVSEGVYSLWYLTESEFTPVFSLPEGLQATYKVEYIKGQRFSSLSRSMDFCKKQSVLGNEIEKGEGLVCPAYSFGYIVLEVTKVDVFGCKNPNASNFNPAATIDDGSCEILGCTDYAASNFNPEANVDNGSCVYPICYQKRWLFKSLPCKISKSNNCNCK